MYKTKFEFYEMMRDFNSNDPKTIQRNAKIIKRLEHRLAHGLADIEKISKKFDKSETLESLCQKVETIQAYDTMVLEDHIQKTHSLDLKIKQLEERIEHLESI